MHIVLRRGSDSLETLVLRDDSAPTELAIVLDGDGPRAVIERDAERCVSVEPTNDRGRVRARVVLYTRRVQQSSGVEIRRPNERRRRF